MHAIAVGGDRVYAAHRRPGRPASSRTPSPARTSWTLTIDGDAQAVAVLGGTVYIGGHFDNVCRSARPATTGACLDGNVRRVKLAAADRDGGGCCPGRRTATGPAACTRWPPARRSGKFAAGGEFTTINGVNQKRLALFG